MSVTADFFRSAVHACARARATTAPPLARPCRHRWSRRDRGPLPERSQPTWSRLGAPRAHSRALHAHGPSPHMHLPSRMHAAASSASSRPSWAARIANPAALSPCASRTSASAEPEPRHSNMSPGYARFSASAAAARAHLRVLACSSASSTSASLPALALARTTPNAAVIASATSRRLEHLELGAPARAELLLHLVSRSLFAPPHSPRSSVLPTGAGGRRHDHGRALRSRVY